MWPFFLERFAPHAGHVSLTTMATVASRVLRLFLLNSSTGSCWEHYLCSTTHSKTVMRWRLGAVLRPPGQSVPQGARDHSAPFPARHGDSDTARHVIVGTQRRDQTAARASDAFPANTSSRPPRRTHARCERRLGGQTLPAPPARCAQRHPSGHPYRHATTIRLVFQARTRPFAVMTCPNVVIWPSVDLLAGCSDPT